MIVEIEINWSSLSTTVHYQNVVDPNHSYNGQKVRKRGNIWYPTCPHWNTPSDLKAFHQSPASQCSPHPVNQTEHQAFNTGTLGFQIKNTVHTEVVDLS